MKNWLVALCFIGLLVPMVQAETIRAPKETLLLDKADKIAPTGLMAKTEKQFADAGCQKALDKIKSDFYQDKTSLALELGIQLSQTQQGFKGSEVCKPIPNEELASDWYRTAAYDNNLEAQFQLGNMYYYGDIPDTNYLQSFYWIKRAAEGGHQAAQYTLALMYLDGNGTKKDEKKAYDWFIKTAENPNAYQDYRARAEHSVAWCYYEAHGVPQDYEKSLEWSERAADSGSTRGMVLLGTHYRYGKAVKKDLKEAINWYKKAAALKEPFAFINLGDMNRTGEGTRINWVEAYKWYSLASNKQFELTSDSIDEKANAEKRLDAKQLIEAQRRASEFEKLN